MSSQEIIVVDYDNMGMRNEAEDGSVGRLGEYTYGSVILRERERSWEVRSYADVARENTESPLEKIDSLFIVYLFNQGISSLGYVRALQTASIVSMVWPAPP